MRLLAHLLAVGADYHADRTLSIFRAGITEVSAASWPIVMPVAVVTRLELTRAEAAQLQQLTFVILHNGTQVGVSPPQPIATHVADPTAPIYVNVISNLGVFIPGPGQITLSASLNEAALPPLYIAAKDLR